MYLAPGHSSCTHGHAPYSRCRLILPSDHFRRCTCARSGIACGKTEDVGAYAPLEHLFTPTPNTNEDRAASTHRGPRTSSTRIVRTMVISLPAKRTLASRPLLSRSTLRPLLELALHAPSSFSRAWV